jgi:CheY-like chemotaxis protein
VKTVLVVEDEFGIAELLKDLLTEEGYRVMTAFSGRQALAQLEEQEPDVVILDFMMPGMNGAGVLKAMAAASTLKHIPVVMMSSLGEATIAEQCTGYRAFLRKPFSLPQVLETIGRLANVADAPDQQVPPA